MKEEILNIPLTQEVIKRGYIKIPASISKGENDEGIVDE